VKAAFFRRYGPPDVLQVEETDKPTPGDDDVLIRTHAATVTAGDCEIRRFDIQPLFWLPLRIAMGIFRPRRQILGQELSGEVVEVGKNAGRFKLGDQVFGPTGFRFGAYADYARLSAKGALALKPGSMSYSEAATVPVGGANALYFLRRGHLQKGQKVLIYGASGSIGTYAVQLARHFGTEVTGVCSAKDVALIKSLGASHVIDYTKEDFADNGVAYDVIFDAVGKSSFSRSLASLKPDGVYLLANPALSHMLRGLWISLTTRRKVIFALASDNTDDLEFLGDLVEAGELRSVIDRTYPLEAIAEAHRYVEKGQKSGNVAITMDA